MALRGSSVVVSASLRGSGRSPRSIQIDGYYQPRYVGTQVSYVVVDP